MTSVPNGRDEMATTIHRRICEESLAECLESEGYCVKAADEILAAGYVKADHTEYAADHKFSDLEFTDEEGELWTDREDFEEYFKDYGGCKLVQRRVTEWEPLA